MMSRVVDSSSKDGASNATLYVMQAIMALAVLTSHWGTHYNLQYVAQVKLPVDYFFFIEGFLAMQGLSNAAPDERVLRAVVRRVWRIYPLQVIGLIAGAATFFALAQAQSGGWSIHFLETSFGLGLLLQPTFSTINEGAVFPLNPPSWAIVLEIWAFAALFLCRRQLTMRVAAITFVVAGVILLGWILLAHDNNMGWRTLNYWGGFPRVVFGFFGGAFLFWLNLAKSVRLPKSHPLLIWGLVIASLVVRVQYASFQLLLLFAIPPIVLLGAASSNPEWLPGCGRVADRHAYGIYLLSYPSLMALRELASWLGIHMEMMASFLGYVVAVGLILLVVHLVVSFLDEPFRRWGDQKFLEASAATR